MKTVAFENDAQRKRHISFPSEFIELQCLDNRRKRIKKYAFLYKSALVWTGENKPKKASVGENILPGFCQDENEYF